MPATTIVTGMVLSAMPVGDFDKRLVLLTKELGKISVFAKGARKQNSALLACSQPFSFGVFTLFAGRSSYQVMSAEIGNYFPELRGDMEGLCYGLYFCEFTDYMTKENNDESKILKLLYQSLRAVAKNTIERPLIRVVFELKAMSENGEAPQVFQCVKCEREAEEYRFSAGHGGILCKECQFQDKYAIPISTSTLYTMQYIVSREIEKLYTFKVSEKVLEELQICLKHYLDRYIDHEFKALEMIKALSQ